MSSNPPVPIAVHPATAERFQDVAAILGPRKRDAPVCWCLAYRIPNQEFQRLRGPDRPARLRRFCAEGPPPGVVAYVDGVAAGWCSFGPRSSLPRLVNSRTIPVVDALPVWSIVCFVVRAGHRRRGLTQRLLEGAIAFARQQGVPALEAYPVDPGGGRISPTLAYVGITSVFERAGFHRVMETGARSGGRPRWLMRLVL